MTIANVEMAKAWDGEEGERWTRLADHYERVGAEIWQRFLGATTINPTDRVLDVGCGTGQSSREVARLTPSGFVLGVDLSSQMLALAAERSGAEGLGNVQFLQADAQVHPFEEGGFDLVISSFGAMFFNDRDAAFRNIAAGLRPGGRLAFLGWERLEDNEWVSAVVQALAAGRNLPLPQPGTPGPFGLADTDGVRQALARAGFEEIAIASIREPLYFGRDVEDAWTFLTNQGIVMGLTHGLEETDRAEALRRLRQVVVDHATDAGVRFAGAASLITARKVAQGPG